MSTLAADMNATATQYHDDSELPEKQPWPWETDPASLLSHSRIPMSEHTSDSSFHRTLPRKRSCAANPVRAHVSSRPVRNEVFCRHALRLLTFHQRRKRARGERASVPRISGPHERIGQRHDNRVVRSNQLPTNLRAFAPEDVATA